MVDLFFAYKPPPAPKLALHPLIVPLLMVMVEEFVAYKPPPAPAEHPLMVPPLMVMVDWFVAYKPPPSFAVHPLIVPPDMTNVASKTWTPLPLLPSRFRISPPYILNVVPESAITARLQFSITPPYMLKTDFEPVTGSEPIITTQALPADVQFCSVTFSYIFAVAPSNTDTKPPLVFPSIVSVPL